MSSIKFGLENVVHTGVYPPSPQPPIHLLEKKIKRRKKIIDHISNH